MPLTLDARPALIVIDLQKGIVSYPTAHPSSVIVARTRVLLDAFRRRRLPVVLVNVAGRAPGRTDAGTARAAPAPEADWAELVPELGLEASDHTVTKRTWGAFSNTDLAAHLQALGATQVVLTGVATSIGVESTARQAYELGFNVALAIDAMTDLSLEAHENSVTRIFPRLGETGTVADIVRLLEAGR